MSSHQPTILPVDKTPKHQTRENLQPVCPSTSLHTQQRRQLLVHRPSHLRLRLVKVAFIVPMQRRRATKHSLLGLVPRRSCTTHQLDHTNKKKRGKGQPTNQQRRTRMPPNIPHQRPDLIPQPIPPPPPPPHPGPRRPRRPPNINPRRQRRVQIPHIHPPIKTPTIHISRIRTPRRRKVAPYQRPPYPVPAERHERVVVRVREPPRRVVVVAPAVLVRVRALVGDARRVEVLEALGRERHAQVPELHGLVFGVGEDVAPVAFGVEVGQAFDVPDEGAGGAGVAEGAGVPDFDGAVVGAGVLGERGLVDLGGGWWGRRGLRGCGGRVCRQRRRR